MREHVTFFIVNSQAIEQKIRSSKPWIVDAVGRVRQALELDFPVLAETYKWNCLMWMRSDELALGVAPLTKSMKICFFIQSKHTAGFVEQRWGTMHNSRNWILEHYDDTTHASFVKLCKRLFS
jgi:hypothetical protein